MRSVALIAASAVTLVLVALVAPPAGAATAGAIPPARGAGVARVARVARVASVASVASVAGRAAPSPRPPHRALAGHADAVPASRAAQRRSARAARRAADAARHASTHTAVTKVLVILTYWSKKDPAVTPALAKQRVITEPNTWYRRASYGHQGLTGTSTSWVRVPKPVCGSTDTSVFRAAERAARRYHPGRYDRIVLYEPCSGGGELGVGFIGAENVVLLQGGLTLPTAVHEQGHNYGLGHANQLSCTSHGRTSTDRPGARCALSEYADFSSAMGAQWNPDVAGDFTAPQKQALGWLKGRVRTVAHSGTVRLAPYETTSGIKAIRVPAAHKRTYWVEFRTRRGNDTHLQSTYIGVLIHLSTPDRSPYKDTQSELLDTVPPDVATTLFSTQTTPAYLPADSSWTTPDGIRFTVTEQSSGSASVTIRRGVRPTRPGPVRRLATRALDGAVSVEFRPASNDGGYPVTSYVVTAEPGGAHRTVHRVGGSAPTVATVRGLTNGTAYRFSVRAVTEDGTGAASTSARVTPQRLYPTPVILSPASGASVSGVVPVRVRATHVAGGSPVERMDLDVDDEGEVATSYGGSVTTLKWDTSGELLGSHTLTLTATDEKGRTKSTSIVVTLTQTTGPVLQVTAPAANATVAGTVQIAGTLAPNPDSGRRIASLEVDLDDGEQLGEIDNPGASWSVDWPTDVSPTGRHVITVQAVDTKGETSTIDVPVVVKPSETLTVSAPASGAAVHGLVHVTGTAGNLSSTAGLTVSITDAADDYLGGQDLGTPPGSSDSFDVPVDLDGHTGTQHLRVTVSDANDQSVTTTITLVVSVVASSVTLTAPAPAVTTVGGTTTFTVDVQNNSGADDPEMVIDVDGTVIDDDTVDAPAGASGTYSVDVDTTQFANGKHVFTFTVNDENGPASAQRTFTVAN